jgi:hypothetical protein
LRIASTAAHRIDVAAPVELRSAFAEAEQRRAAGVEEQRAALVDGDLLDEASALVADLHGDGCGADRDAEIADCVAADAAPGRLLLECDERAVGVEIGRRPILRDDTDTNGRRRQRRQPHFDRRAADGERLPLGAGVDAQRRRCAGESQRFERVAAVHGADSLSPMRTHGLPRKNHEPDGRDADEHHDRQPNHQRRAAGPCPAARKAVAERRSARSQHERARPHERHNDTNPSALWVVPAVDDPSEDQ